MDSREECIARAARTLAAGIAMVDTLPTRLAAESAHYAGGPSVDEIEKMIIDRRSLR